MAKAKGSFMWFSGIILSARIAVLNFTKERMFESVSQNTMFTTCLLAVVVFEVFIFAFALL